MLDLIERRKEDMDRLTLAVASGYGITMSREYAAKWQADHAEKAPAATPEAIQRQNGSIARLASLFPGAVKQRRPD
jgi:hypothetical protein